MKAVTAGRNSRRFMAVMPAGFPDSHSNRRAIWISALPARPARGHRLIGGQFVSELPVD
jgi:hypothetical protein